MEIVVIFAIHIPKIDWILVKFLSDCSRFHKYDHNDGKTYDQTYLIIVWLYERTLCKFLKMKPNQFKNQLISNVLHQYSNEFSLTNNVFAGY
jgi:hypothetical protein